MTPEEALEVWAPQSSLWSPWTKPVLFSFLPAHLTEAHHQDVEPEQAIPLLQDTALVVELPGKRSLYAGLSLAVQGYRPVPLYNATPASFPGIGALPESTPALIDVKQLVDALEQGTTRLIEIPLPVSAPPAFLLDAARHDASFSPHSTWFDNRSIVRTSDVPTGEFLRAQGISQVVLVQTSMKVREDLHSVLLNWQNAGLRISWQAWGKRWDPKGMAMRRPSSLNAFWTRLRLRLQFRPNSSGAFGTFSRGSAG